MPDRLRPHLPAVWLALVLSAVWALRDWGALSALRLPDTDDMMRLQQVRDWIAGQPFADVSQHRLGTGLAMHWSRIGDLVPAALILLVRPLAGTYLAELVAVIAWPVMQFAIALALVGSIAERLSPGARGTAIVLGALAYPATTLFVPGRIDHHGMQLILVLVQLRALLSADPARGGGIAGAAAAACLAIGLETLPFAVLTGAIVALRGRGWQAGYGVMIAIGTAMLQPIAATGGACDTVQPLALPLMLGGAAMALTAELGRWRLVALGGAAALLAAVFHTPLSPCLSGPYGTVDPLVARLWLANVAEAQPLLATAPVYALGYAGLMLVGVALTGLIALRRRGGWWLLLAVQGMSLALTLMQLRGVYVGAALAAVPIAVLLTEARAAGRLLRVVALWLAGAGLLYPIAATAAFGRIGATTDSGPVDCTAPAALARLRHLPPGRTMAPIDVGAYAIAATGMHAVAAPYHRNDAGNAAMLRFYLGPADGALAIARTWGVTGVVLCPGAFDAMGTPPAGSIAGGARPAWLVPLSGPSAVPATYRVADRLPQVHTPE